MVLLSAPLRVDHARLVAIAAIGAHGASDLALDFAVLHYALMYFLLEGTPELAMNAIFLAVSWLHFANDIGKRSSLVLHAAACVAAVWVSREAGMDIVLLFMACWHVPAHIDRLVRADERRALDCVVLTTASAVAVALWHPELIATPPPDAAAADFTVEFSPALQTLVIAHVTFTLPN